MKDGYVTIQGTVKTLDDKRKAEKEIRDMDGVKGLNSQIQTQESPSKNAETERAFPQDTYASSSDDQLNRLLSKLALIGKVDDF